MVIFHSYVKLPEGKWPLLNRCVLNGFSGSGFSGPPTQSAPRRKTAKVVALLQLPLQPQGTNVGRVCGRAKTEFLPKIIGFSKGRSWPSHAKMSVKRIATGN